MAVARRLTGSQMIGMALDVIGTVLLALYALIVGPLGVLRGPIVLERAVLYAWVLIPQRLLARGARAAVDWRLGNFPAAIAQLESLVTANEEYCKRQPGSRARRRVLEDLCTVLVRAYLHSGQIDEAMLVVIRTKRNLGMDRLPGLAELDSKTAHLVRAGLAAGRLLDGGGMATMFVRTPPAAAATGPKIKSRPSAGRQGATSKPPLLSGSAGGATDQPGAPSPGAGAKIIPFPSPRGTEAP